MNLSFWKGKRVFVTGHTGFKGGWLCLWLQARGAKVFGYSLDAPSTPNLFNVSQVGKNLAGHTIDDIRDKSSLILAMQKANPEIVFHLAAQSLVRYSYIEPTETYSVNVMGTVNLLEAVRVTSSVRAVVNVTSDKCYENIELLTGYREDDPLGGHDPYSSSKACSELITSAYRRSYFNTSGPAIASARAGNVIGGGDWAVDRLIPDFLRALDSGVPIRIRSPNAIRPWQHVLEPLSGYILLAEKLFEKNQDFAKAWNFGPFVEDAQPVSWIVEKLVKAIPGASWQIDSEQHPHEANYLRLDSSMARNLLNWKQHWTLSTALEKTITWHMAWKNGKDMYAETLSQIDEYSNLKVK